MEQDEQQDGSITRSRMCANNGKRASPKRWIGDAGQELGIGHWYYRTMTFGTRKHKLASYNL